MNFQTTIIKISRILILGFAMFALGVQAQLPIDVPPGAKDLDLNKPMPLGCSNTMTCLDVTDYLWAKKAAIGEGSSLPFTRAYELVVNGTMLAEHILVHANLEVNQSVYTKYISVSEIGSIAQLGIGTTRPESNLHIRDTSESILKLGTQTINGNAIIIFEEGDQDAMALRYDGEVNKLTIDDETTGDTRLTIMRTSGNVGIGTETPDNKLDVAGTVRAEEIIVETGWADHVFDDDYPLMPLSEVAQYIGQKGHLPGIPTADEVGHGVKLGEMQVSLLEKVEELTLHLIAQEKEMQQLRNRITQLEGVSWSSESSLPCLHGC